MNCLNLHDKIELLPTPIQVVRKITRHVSHLPEDIVKKIATLVNKPKLIAKCRQISKKLETIITENNQQNRLYWEENLKLRWNIDHYYNPEFKIFENEIRNEGIPGIIHDYSEHYKIEKATLKYLKLLDVNYDNLQLVGTDSVSIYKTAKKYLNDTTTKASWLYLAGRHGCEKWRWVDTKPKPQVFTKLLEMAATKGHIKAAYELALCQIGWEIEETDPNTAELMKGIQWLKKAADKNHPFAKKLLHRLEIGKWDSDEYLYTVKISDKSKEFIGQTVGKRPHPDQSHEKGPPHKKPKLS